MNLPVAYDPRRTELATAAKIRKEIASRAV